MNIEAARRAAQNVTKRVLEDTELNELIEVTEFVHAYLQERNEHLVSTSLFDELRSFKRMRNARPKDMNMEDRWYTVIYNGKDVGMIWQESPDLFPDCWTIGISLEDANSTMPLDKCKEYLERTYPGIQMELKTKLDQKHDIQP